MNDVVFCLTFNATGQKKFVNDPVKSVCLEGLFYKLKIMSGWCFVGDSNNGTLKRNLSLERAGREVGSGWKAGYKLPNQRLEYVLQ